MTMSTDYEATDQDLPAELLSAATNRLRLAQDRIRAVAGEMGFVLDTEQIEIFAILLIGLEKTKR